MRLFDIKEVYKALERVVKCQCRELSTPHKIVRGQLDKDPLHLKSLKELGWNGECISISFPSISPLEQPEKEKN